MMRMGQQRACMMGPSCTWPGQQSALACCVPPALAGKCMRPGTVPTACKWAAAAAVQDQGWVQRARRAFLPAPTGLLHRQLLASCSRAGLPTLPRSGGRPANWRNHSHLHSHSRILRSAPCSCTIPHHAGTFSGSFTCRCTPPLPAWPAQLL
jgi:hypothetical protein